jgi:hypothetical protein
MQTKFAFRFVVTGKMLRVPDSMDGGRWIQAHEALTSTANLIKAFDVR